MKKMPFQLFDFIGILFPGILVLFGIKFIIEIFVKFGQYDPFFEKLEIAMFKHDISGITIFFILSFVLGHIIQSSSRIITEKSFKRKFSAHSIKMEALQQHSPEQRAKILNALKKFYDLKEIPEPAIETLCYSPVYDRMSARDKFISLGVFHRSLCFLSIIGMGVSIVFMVMNVINPVENLSNGYFVFSMLFFLYTSVLFFKGYILFTKIAAKIAYGAFYAWWRQHDLGIDQNQKNHLAPVSPS